MSCWDPSGSPSALSQCIPAVHLPEQGSPNPLESSPQPSNASQQMCFVGNTQLNTISSYNLHSNLSSREFLKCLERRTTLLSRNLKEPSAPIPALPAAFPSHLHPNWSLQSLLSAGVFCWLLAALRAQGSSTYLGCSWRCARACNGFWRRS